MSEQLDVAVEATGEPAVDETPGHTPEPEVETEDAVLETPETEETEESVEADASPDVEESSDEEPDFSDLTPNFIPADEVIDKLRIPKEERTRLKETARIARESSEKLESFGGDFSINSLTPLAKILPKAQATDDEVVETLNTLIEANPTIAGQIGFEFATSVFQNELSADLVFKRVLGDNATLKNIKTLLALDKEGLVEKDPDYLGFVPENVRELQLQVETLTKQLQEKDVPVVDKRAERAVKDFEDDIHPEISKKIEKVFERVQWSPDSASAKLVTEIITARMKADPNYTNIVEYLKSTGSYRNGENRVGVAEANLSAIRNKALAQATELVRLIQADRRVQSEKSRNRIVQEKQITKPKEITPQPLPDPTLTLEQRQEIARKKYLASLAD